MPTSPIPLPYLPIPLLSYTSGQGPRTVNQRQLVDKMLARYAAKFGALRELLQNADDAGAGAPQLSSPQTPLSHHRTTYQPSSP